MHEYSIVQALVDRVDAEARARKATAVHRLSVRIGELSGVDMDLLTTAYETFRERTICERAELDLQFVPEPKVGRAEEEVELGEGDLDTVFHDGSAVDLGGAVIDTLALALDPYPRSAGADAALKEAGVMTEEEASPFAALAALKEKMGK